MRAGNPRLFVLTLSATLPVWLLSTGCSKEVKADFPRPPATASMGSTADEPSPEPLELPEPEPVEVELPPEPSAQETPEPEAMAKTPPEPAASRPEPTPEVAEPAPTPPSTQLAGGEAGGGNPALLSKLRRASSLLSSIEHRQLSPPQEEQFMAARGFVAQARKAFNDGDDKRALILIDKGLILAEDVERTSRP